MLRRNVIRVVAPLLCLAPLLLASCASAPKPAPVEPFSLLGKDDALYIYVPVDSHTEFVTQALATLMGLKKSDCEKIAGRIRDLYIGTRGGEGFEVSASGDFPPNYAKLSLTKKNGWEQKTYLSHEYFVQTSSALELSVPCAENVVLSRKVQDALDRFDALQVAGGSAAEDAARAEVRSFFGPDGSGDIRFVSTRPDLFFSAFSGATLTLGVETIKGTFFSLPDRAETFGARLALEMSDPRTVKAAVRLLQLALFGTPAKITMAGEGGIEITDITMTWAEILGLIAK